MNTYSIPHWVWSRSVTLNVEPCPSTFILSLQANTAHHESRRVLVTDVILAMRHRKEHSTCARNRCVSLAVHFLSIMNITITREFEIPRDDYRRGEWCGNRFHKASGGLEKLEEMQRSTE